MMDESLQKLQRKFRNFHEFDSTLEEPDKFIIMIFHHVVLVAIASQSIFFFRQKYKILFTMTHSDYLWISW